MNILLSLAAETYHHRDTFALCLEQQLRIATRTPPCSPPSFEFATPSLLAVTSPSLPVIASPTELGTPFSTFGFSSQTSTDSPASKPFRRRVVEGGGSKEAAQKGSYLSLRHPRRSSIFRGQNLRYLVSCAFYDPTRGTTLPARRERRSTYPTRFPNNGYGHSWEGLQYHVVS